MGRCSPTCAGRFERRRDASTVVLRGKGKNFAAGADVKFFIKSMEAGDLDAHRQLHARRAGCGACWSRTIRARSIAAVDGFALGGGAELMLAADVIAVTPRATIGFPETGIGIYPGLGGTFRLARRVGPGLAKYLIGTGQMLGGAEAVQLGVADHCLAPDQLAPAELAAA